MISEDKTSGHDFLIHSETIGKSFKRKRDLSVSVQDNKRWLQGDYLVLTSGIK